MLQFVVEFCLNGCFFELLHKLLIFSDQRGHPVFLSGRFMRSAPPVRFLLDCLLVQVQLAARGRRAIFFGRHSAATTDREAHLVVMGIATAAAADHQVGHAAIDFLFLL